MSAVAVLSVSHDTGSGGLAISRRSGGFDKGRWPVRWSSDRAGFWPARISPIWAIARVPLSNPPRFQLSSRTRPDLVRSSRQPTAAGCSWAAGPAPWTTSPPACSAPGCRPAAPDGPEPPTRTCSSTPRPPWAPGRPAGPGSTPPCAATPPPSKRCAPTASSRKPWPPAPTRCTWQPPSAWTPAPPSATHPAPGSSSRPQPSSRTRQESPRTQGPDPPTKTEDPSVPVRNPSVRLNSGEKEAPGR